MTSRTDCPYCGSRIMHYEQGLTEIYFCTDCAFYEWYHERLLSGRGRDDSISYYN